MPAQFVDCYNLGGENVWPGQLAKDTWAALAATIRPSR